MTATSTLTDKGLCPILQATERPGEGLKTMRRMSVAGFLLVPAMVWGAEDSDFFLSSLLARSAEKPVATESVGRDTADLLSAAAGVETFPIPCATSLTALLWRSDS